MKNAIVAAWIGSLATLFAVLVALFKEEMRSLWMRPRLDVRINPGAPDCHKTIMTFYSSGNVLARADCYYLRLWVQNKGRLRAEKVQVFIAKVFRKRIDNTFEQMNAFLPMNLKWSHSFYGNERPEVFAEGISPRMGKHCDFGHLVDPTIRERIGQAIPNVPPNQNTLELDLEVLPATGSHLFPPGVYQFEILIGSANAKPVRKKIEMSLSATWYDQEEKMFSDGLGLLEVR